MWCLSRVSVDRALPAAWEIVTPAQVIQGVSERFFDGVDDAVRDGEPAGSVGVVDGCVGHGD
ncbi:MAG TPA: hypothetical protein VHX87_12335 [Galbitalea sp.]|jgi:hypothetical protein|nr:hypothetical protein [Galbitalea sp.]